MLDSRPDNDRQPAAIGPDCPWLEARPGFLSGDVFPELLQSFKDEELSRLQHGEEK